MSLYPLLDRYSSYSSSGKAAHIVCNLDSLPCMPGAVSHEVIGMDRYVIISCFEYIFACWRSLHRPRKERFINGHRAGWLDGAIGKPLAALPEEYMKEYRKRLQILFVYKYLLGFIDWPKLDPFAKVGYYSQISTSLNSRPLSLLFDQDYLSKRQLVALIHEYAL